MLLHSIHTNEYKADKSITDWSKERSPAINISKADISRKSLFNLYLVLPAIMDSNLEGNKSVDVADCKIYWRWIELLLLLQL